jgi:hypothetical protein
MTGNPYRVPLRVSLPSPLLQALRSRAIAEEVPVQALIDRVLIEQVPNALFEFARRYLRESMDGDAAIRHATSTAVPEAEWESLGRGVQ